MSAEIFKFEEFAGSGRGLMARPILLQDVVATVENIESIDWEVHDTTTGNPPQTGSLVVSEVMSAAPVPWALDKVGRTFLWPAPGSLWAVACHKYRIIVKFTTIEEIGGGTFLEVWEVTPKDPTKA
jgi:hypothetical protein